VLGKWKVTENCRLIYVATVTVAFSPKVKKTIMEMHGALIKRSDSYIIYVFADSSTLGLRWIANLQY